MKRSFLFLVILTCSGAFAQARIEQSLRLTENLMNKKELSAKDLQFVEKSFRYGEDHDFFLQVKKNKTFLPSSSWRVQHAFNTIYLTFSGQTFVQISFDPASETAAINGKNFKISSQKSIWSQIRTALQKTPKGKTAFLFRLWIADAYAQNTKLSPEASFLVSSIALESKFSKDIDPQTNAEVNLETFNGEQIQSGGVLKCDSANASGNLNIDVNGVKIPAQFKTSMAQDKEGAALTTTLILGKNPPVSVSKTAAAGAGSSENRALACNYQSIEDGKPKATIRADLLTIASDTRNQRLFNVDVEAALKGQEVQHPLVIRCRAESSGEKMTAESLLDCLKKICSGQIKSSAVDSSFSSPFIDLSSVSPQIQRTATDLETAFDQMKKELVASKDPYNVPGICSQIGDYCDLPEKDLKANATLRKAYATYQQKWEEYQGETRSYRRAVDSAFRSAEAASACCAVSSCREPYNQTRMSHPVLDEGIK